MKFQHAFKMPQRVENIVRNGEIACYKQFLHSHNVFQSYISVVCKNAALCGNALSLEEPVTTIHVVAFEAKRDRD